MSNNKDDTDSQQDCAGDGDADLLRDENQNEENEMGNSATMNNGGDSDEYDGNLDDEGNKDESKLNDEYDDENDDELNEEANSAANLNNNNGEFENEDDEYADFKMDEENNSDQNDADAVKQSESNEDGEKEAKDDHEGQAESKSKTEEDLIKELCDFVRENANLKSEHLENDYFNYEKIKNDSNYISVVESCQERFANDLKPDKINKQIKQIYKELYLTLRTNMLTQATRSKRKPATTVKYEEASLFNDDYSSNFNRAKKTSTSSSSSKTDSSRSNSKPTPTTKEVKNVSIPGSTNNSTSGLPSPSESKNFSKTSKGSANSSSSNQVHHSSSSSSEQSSSSLKRQAPAAVFGSDDWPWNPQKLAKSFASGALPNSEALSKMFAASANAAGANAAANASQNNPLLSLNSMNPASAAASLAAVAAAAASGNNSNFNPLPFFDAEFLRLAASSNPFRMPDFGAAAAAAAASNPYLSGLSHLFRPPGTPGAPQLQFPQTTPSSTSPFLTPTPPMPPLIQSMPGQNASSNPFLNQNQASSSSNSGSSASNQSSQKSSHHHHHNSSQSGNDNHHNNKPSSQSHKEANSSTSNSSSQNKSNSSSKHSSSSLNSNGNGNHSSSRLTNGLGSSLLASSATSKLKLSKFSQLTPTEIQTIKTLINGYKESAAYLIRSADELEQLIGDYNQSS